MKKGPIEKTEHQPKITQTFNPLERIGITLGNKIDSSLNLKMNKRYIPYKYHLDCAAHICVDRHHPFAYTHHGVYLGLGLVIHYDFKQICIVTVEEFAKGQKIYSVNSPISYSPEIVMARAVSRLGEADYHLITNNCEHFARWCRNGR